MKLTASMTIFRCSDKFDVLAVFFSFFPLMALVLGHCTKQMVFYNM